MDIPPSLAQVQPTGVPPAHQVPAGQPGVQQQPPPGQQPPPNAFGQQRNRVENPTQNPNLKAAWAASGHTAVFGVGAPYYDATQCNNKRIVMRLTGNAQQCICIPMAVKGVCYDNCNGYHGALTQEEVRAVATAGGLQVAGL